MYSLFEEEVKERLQSTTLKGQEYKYYCVDSYNGQIAKFVPLVNWNSDNAIVQIFDCWIRENIVRKLGLKAEGLDIDHCARDFSLIELGSGLGIPAFYIAKNYAFKKIVINDGASESIRFIEKNLELNIPYKTPQIEVKEFLWLEEGQSLDSFPELKEGFDFIVGSDVIYDRTAVKSLLWTIKLLLKAGGACVLCNFYSRFNKNEETFWQSVAKFGLQCEVVEFGESKETIVTYIKHAN
jgi:predicted nicotinamide N-methyase